MNEVIFDEINGVGIITLNRPKALNALSLQMIIDINEALIKWEKDDIIKAVIIRGAGERAFCAGGDVRKVYELGPKNADKMSEFFIQEYRLNYHIHSYKKPYIAFIHGITMGGGVGVSLHGLYKISSDDLIFAMPETAIGFTPDVGTNYFLSRCKDYFGFYLALTGTSINAADAKKAGAVDRIVNKKDFDEVIDRYIKTQDIKQATKPFLSSLLPSISPTNHQFIAKHFSQADILAIVNSLKQDSAPLADELVDILSERSPTALCVAHQALIRAQHQSFAHCLQMEFDITYAFLHHPDFYEGVRAMLIDKDKSPKWQPNKLTEVTPEEIAKFFEIGATPAILSLFK